MIEKHEHTHKSCYDGLNLMQERKYRLCFVDLFNKVDLFIQWTFDIRMNGHEGGIFYNCNCFELIGRIIAVFFKNSIKVMGRQLSIHLLRA